VEVKRGTAVTLRPLPDGEPVVLSDPLFAQSADRLELFCGRILHDDVGPRLLTQPVHIPRYRRRALLDLLASNPSNEQLAGFLAPEPPVRLRNSDGDELHECRVTYRVPNAAATFELLAERLVRIGAQVLTRHHPLPDGRAMSLGQLTHERDDFILTANSPARLAEIEAILREAAPDAVERDRHSKRLSPDPAPDARIAVLESYFLLDPAAPAVDSEQLARHTEAGWLDTPGVVGELTPRQAAASPDPAVRAELSAMIDDVEAIRLQSWRAGRPTAGLMNPQRLRDALSITPAD
jgi:hypothetical protein